MARSQRRSFGKILILAAGCGLALFFYLTIRAGAATFVTTGSMIALLFIFSLLFMGLAYVLDPEGANRTFNPSRGYPRQGAGLSILMIVVGVVIGFLYLIRLLQLEERWLR